MSRTSAAEVLTATISVTEELLDIQRMNHGLLDPVKVVEYARNPRTTLHFRFEWDDTEAAELYRIEQARKIIRMELVVVSEGDEGVMRIIPYTGAEDGKVVRAFVSLKRDRRAEDARGYRTLISVLSDDELKWQMLEAARAEMLVFRRKYESLKALAGVFSEMDKLL